MILIMLGSLLPFFLFFKVTYKFKKLDFLKSIVFFVFFFFFCLTVELLVYFNLIKID